MSVSKRAATPLAVEADRERRGARSASRSRLSGLVRAGHGEAVLFRIGVAVIGVHLVDDNFFQPQPGTSGGDHLVSGLVPLAAVIAVAAFYPRFRPGVRAAIALLFGMFGLVTAVERRRVLRPSPPERMRRLIRDVSCAVGV
jgi:hypothetical protein